MTARITEVTLEVVVTPDTTSTNPATVPTHDCALLKKYYVPAVAILGDGQPGMVLRAQPSPYVATPNRIYFARFMSESIVVDPVIELWNFDTYIVGLAYYKSKLVAIAWDPVSQILKARVSTNNGLNWGPSTDLGEGIGPRSFKAQGAGGSGGAGLRLTTDRSGNNLYLFYMHPSPPGNKSMLYRVTSSSSPLTGWSGELNSGFSVPSIGRNFGGATARNSQDTVAFSGPLETKIDGQWVVGAESDDGDFHANHAIFKGTLGGSWVRKYDDGHGGGLSGGQGSNGAMFYDANGDLICTIMDDDGFEVNTHVSSDNGESWWDTPSNAYNQMPSLGGKAGMGQHTGAYVAAWGRTYIFGGLAGLQPISTEKTDLYATRITLDTTETVAMFNDVLGESGVYGCQSFCCPPPPQGPALPARPTTTSGLNAGRSGADQPLSGKAALSYPAPDKGSATTAEREAPKVGNARGA